MSKRKELLIEKELNKNFNKYINKINKKPYAIKIKEKGNYLLLKYQEKDNCDFKRKIVRECRGVILKHNGNSNSVILPQNTGIALQHEIKVTRVAIGFDKFFNYNERLGKLNVKKMKNKKLYGYEKIDGSIILLYYDNYKWNISTSGNIDAHDSPLPNLDKFNSYGDLFDYCFNNQNGNLDLLDKNNTYIFELISPYNRIVVNYEESEIYHIGTRNKITLKENYNYIGIQQPKFKVFNNIKEAIRYTNLLTEKDKNYEGIILRDDDFNRVKIKTELWFKLTKFKNNGVLTTERIVRLIEKGDDKEFISYFPEYKHMVDKILNNSKLIKEILEKEIVQANYNLLKKEYYESVKDSVFLSILMDAYVKKVTDDKSINLQEWIEDKINRLTKPRLYYILENI